MARKAANCQKSITVNLRKGLDAYVRRKARREKRPMNEIINEAVKYYKERGAGTK